MGMKRLGEWFGSFCEMMVHTWLKSLHPTPLPKYQGITTTTVIKQVSNFVYLTGLCDKLILLSIV
jgi:hypothetical protein